MSYKVKMVSDMVGVSVRTLHHYDDIGLLKPKSVTEAGYRLYEEEDIQRLQQILFFKELDFDLQEIKKILDNPNFDRERALKLHRTLLLEKKKRIEKIIESVDKTIESIEGGIEMSKKDMFSGFDMSEIEKHKEKYAEEAKQKYGATDAYKESERRTSKYTKEDWARITKNQENIYRGLAELMSMGRMPSDSDVQDFVGKARQHITDNFYNCTPEIFRGLGEMYIADQRFTENIDKFKTGLAGFLSEGIKYYCDNLK